MKSVHSTSQPVSFLQLSEKVGRETVKQHVAILRAIEAGDPEAASREMATHLEYIKENSTTGEAIS